MTQADDWTYGKRASASQSFPLLLGAESSVKQLGGIEKSAHWEKYQHEATGRAELAVAAKGRVRPGYGMHTHGL